MTTGLNLRPISLDRRANCGDDGEVAIAHRLGPTILTSLLPPMTSWSGPRYQALADEITTLLLDGRIAPDTALPSERELAGQLGVSRSTITAAYRALATSGVLVSRQGSGSVLRLPAGARVGGPSARVRLPEHGEAVIDLSVAATPAGATVLAAAAAAVARLPEFLDTIGYHSYGLPELRALVAERYTARGAPTTPEQVLITNGAQHGLDLALRLMLSPGDRVITELPSYAGALDAIRAGAGRLVGVPFSPDGRWEVAAMTATLRQSAPRLAVLIPDFNNPTGVLIPGSQREAVLSAARRSGTTVVVDESVVELDLRDDGAQMPPAMAALDPGVISLGSISKPVWGGIRVGWIRAGEDVISQLAVLRARSDMSGSLIDQLIASHILSDLEAALQPRRAALRTGRETLLSALSEQLPQWQPNRPEGGLFCWIRLDEPGSTLLTRLAEMQGVLITPGSRFASSGSLERYLRLPFTLPPGTLTEAVRRLAVAWSGREAPVARPSESARLLPI